MDVQEISARLKKIKISVGARASTSVYMNDDMSYVIVTCYPDGISGKYRITAEANTFEFALLRLEENIASELDSIARNRIREMSLAIITTTADVGACSDAALRGHKFSQDEIDRLGSRACEEATRLAAGGPFRIVTASSNGEPALESADHV